jgi:hypothetical protein
MVERKIPLFFDAPARMPTQGDNDILRSSALQEGVLATFELRPRRFDGRSSPEDGLAGHGRLDDAEPRPE